MISVYLPECICAWCSACIKIISIRKAWCVISEPEGSRVNGHSIKPAKIKMIVKIINIRKIKQCLKTAYNPLNDLSIALKKIKRKLSKILSQVSLK